MPQSSIQWKNSLNRPVSERLADSQSVTGSGVKKNVNIHATASHRLVGGKIDAAIQHPVEKFLEPASIGALGGFPIRHRLRREEERKHRSHAVHSDPRGRIGT